MDALEVKTKVKTESERERERERETESERERNKEEGAIKKIEKKNKKYMSLFSKLALIYPN